MNGSDLAFPLAPFTDNSGDTPIYRSAEAGLTKRELFAAMALQGLLAKPFTHSMQNERDAAEIAVIAADALLQALRPSENR